MRGHSAAGRALRAGIVAVLASAATATAAAAAPQDSPAGSNDFGCRPSAAHPRPLVLLHGLGANQKENWSYLSPRFKAAGYCVFSLTYGLDARHMGWPYRPGGVIPMQRSAVEIASYVDRVLAATGASEVDLVGHSEGTVVSRWYLERLGGAAKVQKMVALTPLWRGTEAGGTAILRDLAQPLGLAGPLVNLVASVCGSCPQFLRGSDYMNDLNADGEAVPGVEHTNIVTRYDELVVPYTSGFMSDGGTNILVQDVCPADPSEHLAVAFDPVVDQLMRNALDPASAQPVKCV